MRLLREGTRNFLSIGTRALELQRAAGVAGGGMCVVCGVCGEDEGVAEALEM